MLQYASQWFLNEETLKAANKILVDYHYHLPLAALWGTGQRSSSDGQRFVLRQGSLLGSFCCWGGCAADRVVDAPGRGAGEASR